MKTRELAIKAVHLRFSILLSLSLLALGNASVSTLHQQTENDSSGSSMSEEVKQLLTIVRDQQLRESDNERVVIAIKRLGEMKATPAIDDLVQLLTLRRVLGGTMKTGGAVVYFTPESVFGRYPATQALYWIGKPSLPALIKVIGAEEGGSLASENAIHTVAQIFGDAPSQGVKVSQ